MDAGEDAPAGLAGAAAPGQSSCGTRPGSAPAGTASSRSGGGGGRWFGLCAGGERSGAPRAQGAGREMPWEPLFAGRTRRASAALGRSGLLLPQPAHGCSGVKSCSSLHRLAAARVNAGEVTAIVRWVPGSALAPVLGRQRGDARQGEHHRGQRASGGGHHARCREPPATRGPADRPGTEASAPARRRRARSSIRAARRGRGVSHALACHWEANAGAQPRDRPSPQTAGAPQPASLGKRQVSSHRHLSERLFPGEAQGRGSKETLGVAVAGRSQPDLDKRSPARHSNGFCECIWHFGCCTEPVGHLPPVLSCYKDVCKQIWV